MSTMTITFKKIKNKDKEYIMILNCLDCFDFPDNIVMCLTLDIYAIQKIMHFINMMQNYYKISYFDIEIDNNDFEVTPELEQILKYCPF